MRRMRELSIGHYVAAAVPILAIAYGIFHGKGHAPASGTQTAEVIKPSVYKQDHHEHGARSLASAGGEKDGARGSYAAREEEADENEDSAPPKTDAKTVTAKNEEKAPRAPASDNKPSQVLEGAANDAAAAGAECAQIEYRGEGPQLTRITKGEWTNVMDLFHAAKHELLGWVEKNRHGLSESAANAMERQVRDLKIQRPPASDEPDLSWRGIGIYGQNAEGEPIIKLGGGFVHLAERHPARARFEMARLVAQAWAPCELQRVSPLDATWSPLLKCLGVSEGQGCGTGTFSESGWAVSTTVAAAVWPPGCQISAFKGPEVAQCLSHPTFGKVASIEVGPGIAPVGFAPAEASRAISSTPPATTQPASTHAPSATAISEGGRK